jgi:hypothetical protein
MLDWLASLLLTAGAAVADLFVRQDAPGFPVIQMMVATLVLAAVVAVLVYWQPLVLYCKSRWRAR